MQEATTPFVILIDSLEKHPFSFRGLKTDADKGNRSLVVRTEYKYLGPSHGDYTLKDYEGRIALERKSAEDCYGTVLGFKKRRERFVRELEYLASLEFAAVIVESSLANLLMNPPDYGTDASKPPEVRAKVLYRSIISWMLEFRNVQWVFCDSRRVAEVTAFRLLEKFHKHDARDKREQAKAMESILTQPQGGPSYGHSVTGF